MSKIKSNFNGYASHNTMTFEKLSDNLNRLMAEARLNANELARRTTIPASSIKKIRNNDSPNPTLTTLAPLARFFNITVSQLIGEAILTTESAPHQLISHDDKQHQIPIISWNNAINWPQISENLSFVLTERPYSQASFGLIIEEESCECFPKGTLVLIDPNATIQHQNYALVIKANQKKPILKQILIEEEDIFLKSLLIDNHVTQKSNDCRVLGIVVEYRKYLK